MAEQTSKVDGGGVKDGFVSEKKMEEKETGSKVTEKIVEETKEKPMKPSENVESDFEIISKETTKVLVSKKLDDETQETQAENPTSEAKTTNIETKKDNAGESKSIEKKQETEDKISETTERKKSIVDISVIKEAGESDNTIKTDLQESVSAMPGITKSVSQEILKRSDVTELKQIAQDLAEEEGTEKEEDGSVIDISVVEEITDNGEDNDQGEDIGTVDGLEAEILADDEEVTLVPGEGEQVLELTLTTRHLLPLVSAMVALVAAIYALIFYTNV